MKEISLRGCKTYHHVSGVYEKGKPAKVNDSLAKELLALRTEQGMPYFLLQVDAASEDAKTSNERHQDRVNAGANVVTLDDVAPDATKQPADADVEAADDEELEADTPDDGVEV